MTPEQIKGRLKNIAKAGNVNPNTLMKLFFYERFLERLSKSPYKDNFVLKGGFYLSTLFGFDRRTTVDVDVSFKNIRFEKDFVQTAIMEIASIDVEDGMQFTYLKTNPIRDEDEYGGFRIFLKVALGKMKDTIHLDIATGDPITPREIEYTYKPLLSEEPITVLSYNLETVLAEKLETILRLSDGNTRMKDFYDIYLIYQEGYKNLDMKKLKKAVDTTFQKRNYAYNTKLQLKDIQKSQKLAKQWAVYKNDVNHFYARDLKFDEVLIPLDSLIDSLGI